MRHTALTTRNFSGFVTTSVILGFLTAGIGFVDLAMVAPFGASHVAAIGLGELITAAAFSVFFGYSDLFTTQLAQAESSNGARLLHSLPVALFVLSALVVSAIFILAGLALPFMLGAARGSSAPSWPVADYIMIRFSTAGFLLISLAAIEALKICGLKSLALLTVAAGFLLNIAANVLFLYTPLLGLFWNVEAAVAAATAFAQAAMGFLAVLITCGELSRRHEALQSFDWRAARRELPRFLVEGFSIGSRSLNDWISSTMPVFFISARMGEETTAAALVATRIATLFYRVPQACFNASLVFYSYALVDRTEDHRGDVGRLLVLSALPTTAAAVLFLIAGEWIAGAFKVSVQTDLIMLILLAYFIFLPVYFVENFYGELMAAHEQELFLFRISTVATLLLVPMSYLAVFVAGSAFLAVASRGLIGIPLAMAYWLALRAYSQPVRTA